MKPMSNIPINFFFKIIKWSISCFLFFKDFIYLFLEGKGRRKGEKYRCAVASFVPSTGDLACNPVMCLDWESNW